jgi:hypothetical protein
LTPRRKLARTENVVLMCDDGRKTAPRDNENPSMADNRGEINMFESLATWALCSASMPAT